MNIYLIIPATIFLECYALPSLQMEKNIHSSVFSSVHLWVTVKCFKQWE